MNENETVEGRNVSMYPRDWATVDALAKDMGLTTSSALRAIVREWVQMKGAQVGFSFDVPVQPA